MPDVPSFPRDRSELTGTLEQIQRNRLPGHLGMEIVEISEGRTRLRCRIEPHHLALNGYLHAGSVVALADTAAGYGCLGNLPEDASGFTTLEMKANFLATLVDGVLLADARLLHQGRTTQVWDAEVTAEATGATLALFRCTQMILYPNPT